jgi:hypothetical protein
MENQVTCSKCGGIGNISGDLDDKGFITYHTCDKCNGRGKLYPHEVDYMNIIEAEEDEVREYNESVREDTHCDED